MSYADKVFVDMCNDILNNGTDTKGEKVRPHWEDGQKAYTIKKFGIVNRYDLRKEFPAITLRPTALKSAMDEILWIFQRKSNNTNDLKSNIWDEWADADGSIGKAYGYQIGQKFIHHKLMEVPTNNELRQLEDEYRSIDIRTKFSSFKIDKDNKEKDTYKYYDVILDQIDAVIYDLKHNPYSRRIMTCIWNFNDLNEMNLQPCCWSCNFNVTDEGGSKPVLNMVLNQRSSDVLTANNWNVIQYSILLMMIAQVVGMEAGELMHVITDAHIYDRHVDIVKELITRPQLSPAKVSLNPDITNFYDFTTNDLNIEYYIAGPQVKIPVAI